MTTDRAVLAARLVSLLDVDDPTASLDRLLALARDTADPASRAVVLTQAARAAGLAGDVERAGGWLDEASAFGDDLEVAVRVALERGRLLRSRGLGDAARPWFERALAPEAGTQVEGVLTGV